MRGVIFLSLFLTSSFCFAQTKLSQPIERNVGKVVKQKDSNKVVKSEITGPVGLGEIKIGMTIDELRGLNKNGAVYLSESLTEEYDKYFAKKFPSYTRYISVVSFKESEIFGSGNKYPAEFIFDGDILKLISVEFDNDLQTFNALVDQLKGKFGAGEVKDTSVPGECKLGYGNVLKYEATVNTIAWRQASTGKFVVKSFATIFRNTLCLMKGPEITKKISLSFQEDIDAAKVESNLF